MLLSRLRLPSLIFPAHSLPPQLSTALALSAAIFAFVAIIFAAQCYSAKQKRHNRKHTPSTPVPTSNSSCSLSIMFSVYKQPVPYFAPRYPRPPPITAAPPAVPRDRTGPASTSMFKVPQPFDAFLVLDVEATCFQGTDFHWPNEIIEWPVCLLRWSDKERSGMAGSLQIVDEFRSFVKPTWRPMLSPFCTSLTGITQEQVDDAPYFPEVMSRFSAFLAKNGLIHPKTGERLVRFCWCTDGPFDVRDFVVKQCFISQISMPHWLQGDVMDVRRVVSAWSESKQVPATKKPNFPRRRTPNITVQLRTLGLAPFEGRQHSGIDDTRNITRIVIELARRGIRLEPNTHIHPGRRWPWMGKSGQILEEYCLTTY